MGALSFIIGPIEHIIDKVIPDRAANDAAKAALAESALKGELDQVTDQIQVNLAEAQNKSVFVAGWRPAVGWTCAAAFAYAFLLQPFLIFVVVVFHPTFDPNKLPKLDLATMMPVLGGILGLGAMRSYDKAKGTDNGH